MKENDLAIRVMLKDGCRRGWGVECMLLVVCCKSEVRMYADLRFQSESRLSECVSRELSAQQMQVNSRREREECVVKREKRGNEARLGALKDKGPLLMSQEARGRSFLRPRHVLCVKTDLDIITSPSISMLILNSLH